MTLMRQEQNGSEFEGWEVVQIRVFTSWCNKHLSQIHKQIIRLDRDFSSGIRLIDLIQLLSNAKVKYYYKYPVFKKLKLRNVSLALKLIEKQGIDVDSIDNKSIVRGNLKQILELVWRLIHFYSITNIKPNETELKNDPQQVLLEWIQSKLPQISIHNFNTSWNDGRALSALVDSIKPGLCPGWSVWNPQNRLENTRKAMLEAEEKLGITQLVRPEELVNQVVDERSVFTYLSQFSKVQLLPPLETEGLISRAQTFQALEAFLSNSENLNLGDAIDANFINRIMENIHRTAGNTVDAQPSTQKHIFYVRSPASEKNLSKESKETEKGNGKADGMKKQENETIFFRDSTTSKYYKTEIQKMSTLRRNFQIESDYTDEHRYSSSALSDVFHLDEVDVAKLDASVATPSGAVQKCTLKSLPNGNVGISFVQRESGKHFVSVKKNGKHLTNSPFPVVVRLVNGKHQKQNGYNITIPPIRTDNGPQGKKSFHKPIDDQNKNFSKNVRAKHFQIIENKDSTFTILYEPSDISLFRDASSQADITPPQMVNSDAITDMSPKSSSVSDHPISEIASPAPLASETLKSKVDDLQNHKNEDSKFSKFESLRPKTLEKSCQISKNLECKVTGTVFPKLDTTTIETASSNLSSSENSVSDLTTPKDTELKTTSNKIVTTEDNALKITKTEDNATKTITNKNNAPKTTTTKTLKSNVYKTDSAKDISPKTIKTENVARKITAIKTCTTPEDNKLKTNNSVEDVRPATVMLEANAPKTSTHKTCKPDILHLENENTMSGVMHKEKQPFSSAEIPLFIVDEPDLSLLSVLIKSPSGKEAKGIIKKQSNESAGISFTPKESGEHVVNVFKNGEHVENSPFHIQIAEDQFDVAKVKVFGKGRQHAVAKKNTEFFVDTQNAGPGKLEITMEGSSKVELICNEVEKGICKVSYRTKAPGTYKISVKFSGIDVPGSPFTLISRAK